MHIVSLSVRRSLFGIIGVLFLAPLLSVAACSAMTPEQMPSMPEGEFIQRLGDQSNNILVDKSLTPRQLDVKYHEMMDSSFDINAINEYVIGRTWQQMTPEQKREYLKLFKQLVLRNYEGLLHFHDGEALHVRSVQPQQAEDTVVSTEITHSNGMPATPVDWVVRRKSDGSLAIVDIVVDGVSQNATQHDKFASVLDQNNGDFNAFLNALHQKADQDSPRE